jgi:flavin-dependent dehydrogenase
MLRAIAQDAALAERFCGAAFVERPRVLGPLAATASRAGVEGLLLAGDASGFVDPMTGDGLHLAMRGAWLAARETIRALETADFRGAADRLAEARRRALGPKLWFNRTLRMVSGSPIAIELASRGARIVPGAIERVVRWAGDVP